MSSKFRYGASYSPLVFSEDEWERDLTLMQEAGMNLIRLGDVHGSWDLIEPEPGKYQLEKLDRFYTVAGDYGVDILISTGASGPPLWLAKRHPDVSLLNSRGEHYPLGASYHWACIHHTGYREALVNYLEVLLDFTGRHANHFGWQITNEIGFPFLPPRGEENLGLFCYCDHCKVRFQNWVREKYGTLDALTKAWAWGTSYLVYNDWSDVFPPESPPSAWASVTRWLDWRLFWQSAFADFAGWQHDLISDRDPEHPTSVNTFNFKGFDRFGVFTGLDQWQLAEKVDHIGYDLYPGSGDKLKTRPEHTSMFLDHGRSVARTQGRDFWLHEVESGPIGGWVMGPDHRTDAADIEQYCVEALGHDVKLILFMPWREWDYQPLHWGALVDLDGGRTERLDAAARIGRFLAQYGEQIAQAHVPQSQTAVLESKKNAIFFRGVNQDEELFLAQRGAYRALWEQGYSVDFVDTRNVTPEKLTPYREILLPMLGLLERETCEALESYTRGGGVVVGFARCGTLDANGWFYHQWPNESLGDLFGIETVEPDTLENADVEMNGVRFSGYWNRDRVTVKPGTQVLATFPDGFPAVTVNRYGDGLGVYIATQADSGYLKTESPLLREVLETVERMDGIHPYIKVEEPVLSHRQIDPHLLHGSGESYLLLTSMLDQNEEAQIVLKESRKPVRIQQIFPEQAIIQWHQTSDDQISLKITCQSKEVSILQIIWK
jgi:beta-galactosidase GanA